MTKFPEHGDPDLLPKPTIKLASRERSLFDGNGRLIPSGPELPEDYLYAAEIRNLPWQRKRGDEWTDAAIRARVLSFISNFIKTRAWAFKWDVVEKASAQRMSVLRLPYEQWYLVFGFTRKSDGSRFECAQQFPPADRVDPGLTLRLNQVAVSIDSLEAASS